MSFYGSSFSYNGTSCEEYGLMMYDFGSTSQSDTSFVKLDFDEDRIPRKYQTMHYGAYYKDVLEFNLVFGANDERANKHESFDRYELGMISAWLMNPDGYHYLAIDQPDMDEFRYRCFITDLSTVEFAGDKWAFKCTVHCDSPFAYRLPESHSFTMGATDACVLNNPSTANMYCNPKVTVELSNCASFSIANADDITHTVSITSLPAAMQNDTLVFDGTRGTITASSGLNIYPYCNFKFPRLVCGDNRLTFTGSGTITYDCEFPVNIGG